MRESTGGREAAPPTAGGSTPGSPDPAGAAPARIGFPVDLPDGPRRVRLDVAAVPVPDAFLTALAAHLGPEGVVVADDVLDEAGRGWWAPAPPWAPAGRLPAP